MINLIRTLNMQDEPKFNTNDAISTTAVMALITSNIILAIMLAIEKLITSFHPALTPQCDYMILSFTLFIVEIICEVNLGLEINNYYHKKEKEA